jgi:hypothetical protein
MAAVAAVSPMTTLAALAVLTTLTLAVIGTVRERNLLEIRHGSTLTGQHDVIQKLVFLAIAVSRDLAPFDRLRDVRRREKLLRRPTPASR